MSTFPKIFISNACGKLFFFKDVPKDADDDTDINCWFNNNHIEDIVDNNFHSCDWGEYEETQEIQTPAGGWKVEESESESESESEDVSDSRFHDIMVKNALQKLEDQVIVEHFLFKRVMLVELLGNFKGMKCHFQSESIY